MGRRRTSFDEAKIARFLKEGRGAGNGAEYKPWLTVQDVPSSGREHRVFSRKRALHPLRHLLLELFIDIRLSGAACHPSMETVPPRPRELDWLALDRQTVAAVRECADQIRAIRPPKRISAAEIQRRLGKPGWIGPRQRELPLTVQTLETVCETVEQFQLRRVAWAVVELVGLGLPVRAWRVRKLAGLGTSESGAVKATLAAIERGNRMLTIKQWAFEPEDLEILWLAGLYRTAKLGWQVRVWTKARSRN